MQIRHGALSCNEPQSTVLTLLPLSATKRRQLSVTTTTTAAARAAAATVPVQHVFASTVALARVCTLNANEAAANPTSTPTATPLVATGDAHSLAKALSNPRANSPSLSLSLSLNLSTVAKQCRNSPEAPKKHASQPQQCCFLCVYFAAFFFSHSLFPPFSITLSPSLFSSAFVYLLHFKCSQRCMSSSSSQ